MTERWFPNSMPQPMVDHHTLPWWRGAAEHRLLVQQCDDCHHCQLPPAPICGRCRADNTRLREVSGRGTLYTYTVVHRAVAMDQQLPFVIAVIELDVSDIANGNGVRMMSNIVDAEPGDLRIGRPVAVAWETLSEEVSVPRFRFSD
jgi:uncharacterized OB-fold protein